MDSAVGLVDSRTVVPLPMCLNYIEINVQWFYITKVVVVFWFLAANQLYDRFGQWTLDSGQWASDIVREWDSETVFWFPAVDNASLTFLIQSVSSSGVNKWRDISSSEIHLLRNLVVCTTMLGATYRKRRWYVYCLLISMTSYILVVKTTKILNNSRTTQSHITYRIIPHHIP